MVLLPLSEGDWELPNPLSLWLEFGLEKSPDLKSPEDDLPPLDVDPFLSDGLLNDPDLKSPEDDLLELDFVLLFAPLLVEDLKDPDLKFPEEDLLLGVEDLLLELDFAIAIWVLLPVFKEKNSKSK